MVPKLVKSAGDVKQLSHELYGRAVGSGLVLAILQVSLKITTPLLQNAYWSIRYISERKGLGKPMVQSQLHAGLVAKAKPGSSESCPTGFGMSLRMEVSTVPVPEPHHTYTSCTE